MNIFRTGENMIRSDKFADTLSTSDLYEKEFRHCKSDYQIGGLEHGRVFFTVSTNKPGKSRKITESHTEKLVYEYWTMIDYIHAPSHAPNEKIKIIAGPRTPDILMPGYKVKVR